MTDAPERIWVEHHGSGGALNDGQGEVRLTKPETDLVPVTEYVRADLPVRVLPLVWQDRGETVGHQFKANTAYSCYYVERSKSGLFNWWSPMLRGKIEVKTLDLAKAAAQADHDARIRAAIE
jgi:hypothetical protein